jgi:hypothetical protein
MTRRDFIKKAGLASAAAVSPWILPSGRLFASTGTRLANHVVLCLFAGGVRSFESTRQKEGNLMPYTLPGTGAVSTDIREGMSPLPMPSTAPLLRSGTLFSEFRYQKGPTAHIAAHLTAISGKYLLNGTNAKDRPSFATVFEYYRKHNSPKKSALDAWLITDRSDPYMLFNYSHDPLYGPGFGGNFLQPRTLLKNGYSQLGTSPDFDEEGSAGIRKVQNFFNRSFARYYSQEDAGLVNSEEDAFRLEQFIKTCMAESAKGAYENPWSLGDSMNDDMVNIFFAEKILQAFRPELLVVNMFEVDRGHTDFTLYCDNIRKADYALAHLWNTIQNTPGLANDTILIAVPEHGRNLQHNTLRDAFGRYALDHTSDPVSREIFCLILGPPDKVKQNQLFRDLRGESVDVVPTIGHILGFYDRIIPNTLPGRVLEEAFV